MMIRKVEAQETAHLVTLLVNAFADDPFYQWAFPDQTSLAYHFETSLLQAMQENLAFTTNDAVGVAIWDISPQDKSAKGVEAVVKPSLPKPARFIRAAQQLDKLHPKESHLYLSILATDLRARKRGIGRALVNAIPEFYQQPVPIYLETATQEGKRFYERIGFSVIKEIKIPQGPILWGMQRRPSPHQPTNPPPHQPTNPPTNQPIEHGLVEK